MAMMEPQFRMPNMDETGMKLLWFYSTTTFRSLAPEAGRDPLIGSILNTIFLREALRNEFLLDCLLSLSATHFRSLRQDIRLSTAFNYRVKALRGYRRAIENAKPETYPALLAGAILLNTLSTQMFRERDIKELYILDWIVLFRGLLLIIHTVPVEVLRNSSMGPLLICPPIDFDRAALSAPNYLLTLISSIEMDDPDSEHIEVYNKALTCLGILYAELQSGFGLALTIMVPRGIYLLPPVAIQLARERRPRMLIILAHYLAFFKFLDFFRRSCLHKSLFL